MDKADTRLLDLQREKSYQAIRHEVWIEPDVGDIPLIRLRAFGPFFPMSLDGLRATLVIRTSKEARVDVPGTLHACIPSRVRGTWYTFTFTPDTNDPIPIVFERNRHIQWSNVELVILLFPRGNMIIENRVNIWNP